MVFQPNSTTFKAAFHLCICNHSLTDYFMSCSVFSSHKLRTQILKKIFLCPEMEINGQNSDDQTEDVSDYFILADTYCAVAPDELSPESIWFIKVKASFESAVEMIDDYENFIAPGLRYTEGRFLEKVDVLAKGFLYKLFNKRTFFFNESVVYPVVQLKGHKKGFFLSQRKSTLKY